MRNTFAVPPRYDVLEFNPSLAMSSSIAFLNLVAWAQIWQGVDPNHYELRD